MRKMLLLTPFCLLLLAQTPQNSAVELKGVQSVLIPDSEGGGDNVYLQTEHGFIGPFLRLPSLPGGVGYGSTEVAPPKWPGEPCNRGNWARTNQYFFMCVSVPVEEQPSGTIWRRIAWDREWDSVPAPE